MARNNFKKKISEIETTPRPKQSQSLEQSPGRKIRFGFRKKGKEEKPLKQGERGRRRREPGTFNNPKLKSSTP